MQIKHTLKRSRAGISVDGNEYNFSTPPVSFQNINRLVGGAKSNDVIMSDVLANWFFISSPEIFFTSSTINFRFRFVFVAPFRAEASMGANAKASLSSSCSGMTASPVPETLRKH